MRAAVPIALVVAVFAALGCGKTIDESKAEKQLAIAVENDSSGAVDVKKVDCPSGVELEEGKQFTCIVTARNGRTGKIVVTQKDDAGHVRFKADLGALVGR